METNATQLDDDLLQFTLDENNSNNNDSNPFKKKRPPPTFQAAFSQARLPSHSSLVNYHQAFNTNLRSETLLEDTFIKSINPSPAHHPTGSSTLLNPNQKPTTTQIKHTGTQHTPDDLHDAAARFLASFVTSQSDSPPSSSEPSNHLSNPIHHLDHHPILQSSHDPPISIEPHPLQLLTIQNQSPTPIHHLTHRSPDHNEHNHPTSPSLGFSSASSTRESNQSRTPSPSLPAQPPSRPQTDPALSNTPHKTNTLNTLQLPSRPPSLQLCLPPHPRQIHAGSSLLSSVTSSSSTTTKTSNQIPSKRPIPPTHQPSSSTTKPASKPKKIKLAPQIFMNKPQQRPNPIQSSTSSHTLSNGLNPSSSPISAPTPAAGVGSTCTNSDQIQIWKKIQLLRSQRLTSLSKNSSIAEFHLDRLEKQWIETLRQAGTISSAIQLKNQVENYQELIKKIQDLLGEELVRVQIEESILRHVRGIIADRLIQIQEWN